MKFVSRLDRDLFDTFKLSVFLDLETLMQRKLINASCQMERHGYACLGRSTFIGRPPS